LSGFTYSASVPPLPSFPQRDEVLLHLMYGFATWELAKAGLQLAGDNRIYRQLSAQSQAITESTDR
jgi:hypothetical protein